MLLLHAHIEYIDVVPQSPDQNLKLLVEVWRQESLWVSDGLALRFRNLLAGKWH